MREIGRQGIRLGEFRRRLGHQRDGEFAHDGVDEARFRGTGEMLGLLDRVMHDLGCPPIGDRLTGGLEQLETGNQQPRPGREPRRMRDQPSKFRIDPAEMPHDPEHEVLASCPLRPAQSRRKTGKQFVASFPAVEPAGQQPGRGRPGPRRFRKRWIRHVGLR